MMNETLIQKKLIDGKMYYRGPDMPEGTWRELPSSIDILLNHLQQKLRIQRGTLLTLLGINSASISRCRHGQLVSFPLEWLIRMYDLSGIPIDELRKLADIKPTVGRHHRAE